MRRTGTTVMVALLAALLLAAGCGSEDEDESAVQYKVLGGRLVWCSGGAEDMTVPGNASSIGNNAFGNCGSIGTLTIPASVTHIMRHTFSGVRVGKIIFGGTVGEWAAMAEQDGFGETLDGTPVICSDGEWRWTAPAVPDVPVKPDEPWEIEDGVVVKYTGSATNETIPSNVTAIAGGAFEGHTELERVVIPAGVTAIAPGAFAGSGITEIEYKGTTAEWDALVEAGGIADELDGITVKCSDGTWTPAHIHAWGETYTNGGEGGHYKTCTECDEHSATEAHTYGGTPQADDDGGHYRICTATGCGARSETEPHHYTYADGGDTHTMTCADCNYTKTEPHAYGGETYTDAGHVKTCTKCEHSETETHAYGNYTDDKNGKHYQVCSVCSGKSEAVEHDCEYEDNADGTHTTTCTKCAYSQTEAHRYKDGMCEACGCPDPTKVYVASTGSDTNAGSRAAPFATIQKAVDAVLAANDGASAYTIYVDGTLKCNARTYIGASGMADFSALTKNLTLTIKPISGTATLDGGARFDTDGNVTNAGIGKRVIYANPASGILNLTLENLVITGGNASDNGGGIYFISAGGSLTMTGCEVSGNKATTNGGGIYLEGSTATFTMTGGTISGNTVKKYGGGVFVTGGCTFTMSNGEISGNEGFNGGGVYLDSSSSTFIMNGGEISGNITRTSGCGGGVYITGGTFTMESGTISGNTARKYGGGVYVWASSTFTMSGGEITGNTAGTSKNGVYGTFTQTGGTVQAD